MDEVHSQVFYMQVSNRVNYLQLWSTLQQTMSATVVEHTLTAVYVCRTPLMGEFCILQVDFLSSWSILSDISKRQQQCELSHCLNS